MSKNIVKKFKIFWAWQDEKEEIWLSEMDKQGFHLEKISLPGWYKFSIGESRKFIYRLDFQSLRSKDRESYLQLFADSGWEHVGNMSSWEYFRREVQPGDTPDIYSDVESKTGKYRRVMIYLSILLPIMIVLKPDGSDRYGPFLYFFYYILEGFYILLILFFSYSIIQLFRRINQLNKKNK